MASIAYEIDANRRAREAGFRNAAEQEMDANRRSREAGFINAVDQEIDANRRAREAGFTNAAELETYGPIDAIRSTDPFVDPRSQGILSYQPATPQGGILGPPIQAGGGYGSMGEYLVPPQYTGPASADPYVMQSSMGPGWDYQYPGMSPNGMIMGWGGAGGYPGGGSGGYLGGGGGALGPIGPGTGAAGGGGTKYPGVPPGSQQESDMDKGITHHPGFYDADGNYVGAEGTSYDDQGFEIDRQGRRTGGYINDSLGIGNKILGWMGADPAEVQRTRAIMADADMDVAASVGAATQGKYGTGGYQGTGVNAQAAAVTQPAAQPAVAAQPVGPSAEDFRRAEARLANLQGRDRGVDPAEVAALEAMLEAEFGHTGGGLLGANLWGGGPEDPTSHGFVDWDE